MLIQTSLLSSVEVALYSDSSKHDLFCDWTPGAHIRQKCPCYDTRQGGGDCIRSCSQSAMSEVSALNLVYQRRKLPKNSLTVLTSGSVSALSSEAKDENEEHFSDEARKSKIQKLADLGSVNDSCSSSKSNMDQGSTSETGECSSSGILTIGPTGEELSEKEICISILRSHGLLRGVCPEGPRFSNENSCSRSCKICSHIESTLNMLICDQCEEAFHVSCCNPRVKKIPGDEWFCQSCFKKRPKILKEASIRTSTGKFRSATSRCELNPIAFMLKDKEAYTTGVRIGKAFQAEVPEWSGPNPITIDIDLVGEPLEADTSEFNSSHESSTLKQCRLSSIGNWLQCREVIDGVGEGVDGTVCGKWRRAPLFEVQTDDWECFSCVHWDPTHSDCAVPQELETAEVLKHLKYIELLRPRITAKKQSGNNIKTL